MKSACSGLLIFGAALAISAAPKPATPDHPRWAVRVSSDDHSYFIDRPICHPLGYFRGNASNLNYHHTGTVHIESGTTKDEVESHQVGQVAGYAIYQISHDIHGGELRLKMLVVERAAGEYCEIYHQEWMGEGLYSDVSPAYLLTAGSETILATHDVVTGDGNWSDEHYWAFDKEGPIDLYVSEQIREIEKKLLPKGLAVMNGDGLDIQSLTYFTPVWRPVDAQCCPLGGTLRIEFAFSGHHLVVASQTFKSN